LKLKKGSSINFDHWEKTAFKKLMFLINLKKECKKPGEKGKRVLKNLRWEVVHEETEIIKKTHNVVISVWQTFYRLTQTQCKGRISSNY
jgi:hypothetical protein